MEKDPITLLICGAGSRGRTVYGRHALENPRLARVVAVAEPDSEKRNALAREHSIPAEACFPDWQSAHIAKVRADVAIVATNDHDHVEPAVAFLDSGYHLLLEKPMAPNLQDCRRIVEASLKAKGYSSVCHVLRYTAYFRKLKDLINQGCVGELINVRHLEPINFWHFAHSFVRGNWGNSEKTSPLILAKCCHDMDILLYLIGKQPQAIQSFGGLHHFRPEQAPQGAADRCWDCPAETQCPYSAKRFYGNFLKENYHGWPLDVVTNTFTEDALKKALDQGPYGRCVYRCDNDVCDHQVVNVEFAGGVTASMTATAFTERPARETEIFGSHGSLKGDGETILHQDFVTRKETLYKVESQGHHLGGDDGMLAEFYSAIREGQPSLISSSPEISLRSHEMALWAEESRKTGQIKRWTD